jgi:O-antigen biosynthesis protein WbqP
MKRFSDIVISSISLVILFPLICLISIIIIITSKGSITFLSSRVGRNNIIFKMPKFRTMVSGTPQLATHLLKNPESYYTQIGHFIRKYSLDEIPQLFTILTGDMSLVGPRPALFNQTDLINMRTKKGIHAMKPGLTGWAQVNGRDDISIVKKVDLDYYYMKRRSMSFDIYIIWLTLMKVIKKENVSH